jgi:hypothetical protein
MSCLLRRQLPGSDTITMKLVITNSYEPFFEMAWRVSKPGVGRFIQATWQEAPQKMIRARTPRRWGWGTPLRKRAVSRIGFKLADLRPDANKQF